MPEHVVTQGDCMSSIAERYGFFWETLWEHPQNAGLKGAGRHPNALHPGDVVFIPEKRLRSYTRATGAKHTWRVRGVPVKVRLRLLDDDVPRAGVPFTLSVEGVETSGATDPDGWLEATVPPGAQRGTLRLGEGDDVQECEVWLGHLDPVETLTGVQGRLMNLGYGCSPTGALDDATRDAVAAFQATAGLAATGEIDDATRAKLRALHDDR